MLWEFVYWRALALVSKKSMLNFLTRVGVYLGRPCGYALLCCQITHIHWEEDCASTGVCLNGFSPLPPLSPLSQIYPIFHPHFFSFLLPLLTFSLLLYLCLWQFASQFPSSPILIHLLITSAVLVPLGVMRSPSPSGNSHTSDHVCVLYSKRCIMLMHMYSDGGKLHFALLLGSSNLR